MSFKVIQKGPSLQAIIKTIGKMEDEYVAVGLFSKGAGNDYDKNLAMRMAHFEKGSVKANLPARPVFGTTMADRKKEVKVLIGKLFGKVLAGKLTRKEAYEILGIDYTKMLKIQFRRRKFAALSPNYRVRPSGKKVTASSIPLLDTEKMKNNITYEVVM